VNTKYKTIKTKLNNKKNKKIKQNNNFFNSFNY
jgi:hypothetical protein